MTERTKSVLSSAAPHSRGVSFVGNQGRANSQLTRSNVKQGWVFKKPLKSTKRTSIRYAFKGWKKRWFVLKKTCLYYFENDYESTPLGCISLDEVNVQVENDKSEKTHKFQFSIVTPYATHLMALDEEAERDSWVECIISVCGAYKLDKQVEFITKLRVRVLEAKIYDTKDVDNSSVYCSVKTSFQENKTVKQYKTDTPIWNETFTFDLPRFPCELYVYLQYEEREQILAYQFVDLKSKKSKKSMIQQPAEGLDTEMVTSKQSIGLMRMTITEPEVQVAEAGSPGELEEDEEGQYSETSPRKRYHATSVGDFQLRTEGWFTVSREQKSQFGNKQTFVVQEEASPVKNKRSATDVLLSPPSNEEEGTRAVRSMEYKPSSSTSSTQEAVPKKTTTASILQRQKLASSGVIGEVYLELEYIFEDLEGYPISFGTYLETQKQKQKEEASTGSPKPVEDKDSTRRKMITRRYQQQIRRIKTERNEEIKMRIEAETKNKLKELRETYKQEEEKFKSAVLEMKENEKLQKEMIEERLKVEESEKLKILKEKLLQEEEERKRMLNEAAERAKLKAEQESLEMIQKIQTQKEQKLKELEEVESTKLREIEERIKREEQKLREQIERKMRQEEEARLQEIEEKLKLEEEAKVKKLKREIAKLEKENKSKKEYLEAQELKRKQMEQELKKEEKERLAALQAQIRQEELKMLKQLQERVKNEERERLKELEQEINQLEVKQKSEFEQRIAEETKKLEQRLMNAKERARSASVVAPIPPPPPPTSKQAPPPPPPPPVTVLASGAVVQHLPAQQLSNPLDEIEHAKNRLKRVDLKQEKKKAKESQRTNSVLATLMKRRKAVESDSESDEEEEDEPSQEAGNAILDMIHKRIGMLEQEKEDKEWNDMFGNDEDW